MSQPPFVPYPTAERSFIAANPGQRPASKTTGAKRGRKPKGATADASRASSQGPTPTSSQPANVQWPTVQTNIAASSSATSFTVPLHSSPVTAASPQSPHVSVQVAPIVALPDASTSVASPAVQPSQSDADGGDATKPEPPAIMVPGAEDEDEDEMLPAMADDDYSAQLSFQSQSKDNLKVLMDNFSGAQYDRFEAYRRHALPKQAVRKVIQQTLGHQVSQPVAQIVAGFAKVFVGEMVEKAREVQLRRGDVGPLSPDHLREAYRMYQEETGRVGAARPLKNKRLFVR